MSLAVVIPVYNEEKSIALLLTDLIQLLLRLNIDFNIVVINDGSTDDSLSILQSIAATNKNITLLDEKNAGHGASLLKGYAAANKAEMVFQLDSDYQYSLEAFEKLWEQRKNYQLLVAEREQKKSSISRDIISLISRLQTHLLFGGSLKDVNSPFRLMNNNMLKKALKTIPPDTFAPNMLISAFCVAKKLPIYTSTCRLNPTIPVKKSKLSSRLFSGSIKTFSDMLSFRFNSQQNEK